MERGRREESPPSVLPPGAVSWGRVYRHTAPSYRGLSQFNGSRGTVRTVLGLSGGT